MKKIVFSLALIAMFISSCNNGEIDEISNRIDKLEQKIPTIDEQAASIAQSIIALEKVDLELENLIDKLENTNNVSSTMVAEFKAQDFELHSRIDNLQKFVDEELKSSNDWLTLTFATLEQYNAIATSIAEIKVWVSISKIGDKTQTLNSAISDAENSMKNWVGDLLSNYDSIAETNAKIAIMEREQANNYDAIEDINNEVEELKTSLKKAKEELTTAYKSAIEDAIVSNNGVINNRIAKEIETLNSRIDNKISAINNRLNDIERRLDALEDKVDDLYERKLNIEFGDIENIGIVAGGTCKVNYVITQSAPPVHIATIAQNGWRANVTKTSENEGYITVYAPNPLTSEPVIVLVSDENTTIMRSLSFVEGVTTIVTKAYAITSEATTLNIDVQTNLDYTVNIPTEANSWISLKDITTRATMRNDVIKLDVEENTSKTSRSATLQLVCNDTEVGTISIYQQGVEIANNELIYTSSDGKIVTPYQTMGFSANIISNTYSNGRGLIVFDKDITSIGEYAFYKCSKLTSIRMPESVTLIKEYAFYGTGLNSVQMSDNITQIGDYSFYKTYITNIDIPNTTIYIGQYAFCNSSLRNVMLPNSVTSIEKCAFYGCSYLSNIVIGEGVANIGSRAFESCNALTVVYCKPTTPPTLSSYSSDLDNLILYVPAASVSLYKSHDIWGNFRIMPYDF